MRKTLKIVIGKSLKILDKEGKKVKIVSLFNLNYSWHYKNL